MNYIYAPTVPHPETGNIIPHQTKGITAYITKSNQEFQARLLYVMIVAGALMLLPDISIRVSFGG